MLFKDTKAVWKQEEKIITQIKKVFLNPYCSKRYYKLILKGFILDKNINEGSFANHGIDEVLKNCRVFGLMFYLQPFLKRVVY